MPAGWRRGGRRVLALLLAAALAVNLWAAVRIAADPRLTWLAERPLAEIRLRVEAALSADVTAAFLAREVASALDAEPADWVRIDALRALGAERGLALPPELAARLAEAEARERGPLAAAADCAACVVDPRSCPLAPELLCSLAVEVTPLGDLRSLVQAGIDWRAGRAVDRIDLALSAVGLAATAGVFVSGGTSYPAKLGAGFLKAARAAGVLGARFTRQLSGLAEGLVDLRKLPADPAALRPRHLAAALDRDRLAALGRLAEDLAGAQAGLGTVATLRALRAVEGPAEARRLRRAAEALGPRAAPALEALGPARVLRATLRVSRAVRNLGLALLGAAAALLGLGLSLAGTAALRGLRRALRG